MTKAERIRASIRSTRERRKTQQANGSWKIPNTVRCGAQLDLTLSDRYIRCSCGWGQPSGYVQADRDQGAPLVILSVFGPSGQSSGKGLA